MTILTHTKPDVVLFDDLPPEAAAMVLALYSRDPRSVRDHRRRVAEVGPDKFMAQFYVGYGHKSIGDCGSTTACIEHISMLAAKAFQQNPLYNGQEASTRYLDMTAEAVLNPLGTTEGEDIQKIWMSTYSFTLKNLVPYLSEKYPRADGENERVYEKAIKARAFDIARSLLPAGCTTYVGWHTNLRQAWDHVLSLLFHPLPEVRESAELVLSELRSKYPNSFGFKTTPEQDAYMKMCGYLEYFEDPMCPSFSSESKLDEGALRGHNLLVNRPKWCELPDWYEQYGQMRFRFLLDFGSFRDLQRHRSCTLRMPRLTIQHGFNSWYIESMPAECRQVILHNLREQEKAIEKIADPDLRQYYVAMGYNVACHMTACLPSAVYIAELRSGQAVHPTLRPIAQKIGLALKEAIPDMTLHCDMSEDRWSIVRGKHDIVKK